jgi:hypothetical protein
MTVSVAVTSKLSIMYASGSDRDHSKGLVFNNLQSICLTLRSRTKKRKHTSLPGLIRIYIKAVFLRLSFLRLHINGYETFLVKFIYFMTYLT